MWIYQILIASLLMNFNPESGKIEIEISEFRNTNGHVLVSLFDNGKDFPDQAEAAFKTLKVKVSKKKHTLTFENVPYGEYAIIFLHDENDNQEMDTNFVGAPKEGYGASNDAVNTFSEPKYSEAKFKLQQEIIKLDLKVFY